MVCDRKGDLDFFRGEIELFFLGREKVDEGLAEW